jgi:hypothetical protein
VPRQRLSAFFGVGFEREGNIETVVVGNAEVVPAVTVVVRHKVSELVVATGGQGQRRTRVVDESGAQFCPLAEVIEARQVQVVGLVKATGVPLIVVNALHQTLGTGEGVAYPAVETTFDLLELKFGPVGPALANKHLSFDEFVSAPGRHRLRSR